MKPQPRYQPGDRIGDRYQVHKALMGGMGEVYLCLDLEEMVPRALKTFQQRYVADTEHLKIAFEREIATWVALEKHPNIVRCYYMKILDNQPFMRLEWIAGDKNRGIDLRSWLHNGPLDLKLALEIAIDICRGMIHAQTKCLGLVHRDLKPENILISQDGIAKITDFGLVEIATEGKLGPLSDGVVTSKRQRLISIQGIAGTPVYMPPEQWRSERLDERTDIYALAVILYEMLTGKPPFVTNVELIAAANLSLWLRAMQTAHEHGSYHPLPTSLPAALNDLLETCLAKIPSKRPTFQDLLKQMTAVYNTYVGDSLPARPEQGEFTAGDYNNRGITYTDIGRHTEAFTDFAHAIELDPHFAPAYCNRANTYQSLEQHGLAVSDYTQAIMLDSSFAYAYYNRGISQKDLEKYKEALADFSHAIELDPHFTKASYNRGNTYLALGEFAKAIEDYNCTLKFDSKHAAAYTNRGLTYHAIGQYAAALDDYNHAIELDPNNADTYLNRGNVYRMLQHLELALVDYNQAVTLDSTLSKAYYNRGIIHHAFQNYEVALADYSQATALGFCDAMVYLHRGLTHVVLQSYKAALADFTRAIELEPNESQAYYNRGVTHHVLQKHESARSDYSRTIALDPSHAAAHLNLGALLARASQFQKALPHFEKAAQLGSQEGMQSAERVREILRTTTLPSGKIV